MTTIAFVGGTAVLPDSLLENASVLCRDGRIEAVASGVESPVDASVVDCRGKYLAPGYIDIHVHGGAGADFMDGSVEAVRSASRAHARRGTTTLFPTTTTGSPQQIAAMIDACREAAQTTHVPNIAGVHLYGPYFAADKVGCHSQDGRRPPKAAEYEDYFRAGFVRIATCAAELPCAEEFYRRADEAGCLVTCGHSNADWDEMQRAFDAGMRHVDHFWCAMSSVDSLRHRFGVPMRASMVEFVLMNDRMSTEVIADGCHLSPQLLEFAYRMIGSRRLCLVSDSNRAMDMPPGEYRFGSEQEGTTIRSDGRVGWTADGTALASSVQAIDHMVRRMKEATSASLPEVIRMASLTPAERAGVADQTGSIEAGKRADLLVLSRQLEVEQVYIDGELFDQ